MSNTLSQVMNSLALKFLSRRGGTCDRQLPGYRAISTMGPSRDVQGAYMYPKALGDQVQQFYLSCMQGWERKGKIATKALPHNSETIRGDKCFRLATAPIPPSFSRISKKP